MEIILALIGLFFLFYILRGVLRFSKINYNTNLEQYMQMLEVPDEFFEEDQWGQRHLIFQLLTNASDLLSPPLTNGANLLDN